VHGEYALPWGASIIVLINLNCKYHETVLTLHAKYVTAFQVLVFPLTLLSTRLKLPAHVLASTSTYTDIWTIWILLLAAQREFIRCGDHRTTFSLQTKYYTMLNTPVISWQLRYWRASTLFGPRGT